MMPARSVAGITEPLEAAPIQRKPESAGRARRYHRAVRPLVPARLAFDASGVPRSEEYGDVYHSVDGGVAQARHVFLAGNGLPERWHGRASFTIVETGFGLGINFLAACAALLEDPRAPSRLHYVSVEKHPFRKDDMATALARHPEISLARELVALWPLLLPGFHRLHPARGRVTLTLLFGDAEQLLPQLEARADAFFLDGFAPQKNPEMWSAAVARELARLSAPGATFATWTVAGAVRRALADAGFSVEKRAGFGHKREMLAGSYTGHAQDAVAPDRRVAIVGAGIAGTCCAERLSARGWAVTLIDRQPAPAREGSGNPAGLLRPLLNLEDGTNARLSRAALGYALRCLAMLHGAIWGVSGVLQLVRNAEQVNRFERIVEAHGFPPEFARFVDAREAERIAGRAVRGPGWWMPSAGWVAPKSLCAANLVLHADRIEQRFASEAARLERSRDIWRIEGAHGALIAEAPVVILANAADARALAPGLGLEAERGQVSLLPPAQSRTLAVPVCGDGLVVPLPGGGFCIGATLQRDDPDLALRDTDHAENLARAESLLPGFTEGADAASLSGHAAFRASTPDRLPLVGALAAGGLHALLGLGMRGLVWAPLLAELLAARLEGEPLPVERDLAWAVEARRFSPATATSGIRPDQPSPVRSGQG